MGNDEDEYQNEDGENLNMVSLEDIEKIWEIGSEKSNAS